MSDAGCSKPVDVLHPSSCILHAGGACFLTLLGPRGPARRIGQFLIQDWADFDPTPEYVDGAGTVSPHQSR